MKSCFDQYGGRLVNTWGDAMIAEFVSVVEAVRYAVDIQDAISSDNTVSSDDETMTFRIGINLGDVMVDGDDIYGDGVNVAARLESMAPPGGVLISQSVYEFAHRQLAIAFDYESEKAGKSGENAIAVYSIKIGGNNDPAANTVDDPNTAGEDLPDNSTVAKSSSNPVFGVIEWVRNQPHHNRSFTTLVHLSIGGSFAFNIDDIQVRPAMSIVDEFGVAVWSFELLI